MSSHYPPKKPTKKEINFALDVYTTAELKTEAEIEAMPPDPTPKQRKKYTSVELPIQREVVQKFQTEYPGFIVISLRDEKTNWLESEKQLQAGVKRPDTVFMVMKHGAGALWIEVKASRDDYLTKKGKIRQSKHIQGQYHSLLWLRRQGYLAFFAGGFEEAWSIIQWYMEGEGAHPLEYLYSDVLGEVMLQEINPSTVRRNGKIILDQDKFEEWLKK